MNTVATFESQAFNTSEVKPYFINPCCFGDDLARWLMKELAARGVRVDVDLGQEDFGWYFRCSLNEEAHCLVIGGDAEGGWYVVVERACGLFAALLGARHRNVGPAVLAALEEVLSRSDRVADLRWQSWREFRSGRAA